MGTPSPGNEAPVSVRSSLGNNGGCLVAFCGIFFAVGLIFFVLQFCVPAIQIGAARSWTPTTCVITGTQIRTHRSDDSTTYSFEVAYTYSVGGKSYIGDRYGFGKANGSYAAKSALVAAYPVGSKATCFVNPSDPTSAVLTRDFSPEIWNGLFCLVFVIAGGLGMFFSSRAMRATNRTKVNWKPASNVESPAAAVTTTPSSAVQLSPFESGPFSPIDRERYRSSNSVASAGSSQAPVKLKARTTAGGRVIGSLIAAIFWNSIVGVFVWQAGKDFFSHGLAFSNLFMGLFMLPFIAIGLVILIYAGGQILALLNAKASLTISNPSPAPGQTVDLQWEFGGGLFYPRSVTVALEGREEATYRRGTDSVTDKSTFFYETIHDSTAENLQRSQGQVTIPADTMHSLASTNNKIVWTLSVNGEIKGWPNISEEYTLVVAPAGRR